ncbi:MAG: hypothetical protein KatS3mg003_2268 [Candidatus Nitrosocaldaceae archaeon]|nr:MAG: hypothetical protein KatS3mg003_2268 [Candidatus Nitrosocaldaceae archaeon]
MSIEERVRRLGWKYDNGKIMRIFEFASFREVIEFISDIADIIEKMKHYPLITIDSINVKIALPREKQLGEKDLALANVIEKIYDEKYSLAYLEDEEFELLQREDSKEKAKHRTRGPYRKSSSAGLL